MTHDAVAPHRGLDGPARVLLGAVAGGTLLRLVAGAIMGLGIDEQYALAVARTFQLSFFDHPPLGFWLCTLARSVTGSEAALVLRLPFIALAVVTTLLLFRFTAGLFGRAAGGWAALLFNLTPLFGIVGGSWVMPDGPLLAAAMATACCLLPIIRATPEAPVASGRAWAAWLGAGLCLGLAMLAKYIAVFHALGVVLFVATTPGARCWLLRPAPWVACLLALVVFAPVLAWNATHDWASFAFQGGRATTQGELRPGYVVQMIFGAALYLTPWVWWPLLVEAAKAARAGPRDRAAWFCLCAAAPAVIGLTLIPLWGKRGLPHWPAIGFLFLLPILGRATAAALAGPPRGRRVTAGWLRFTVLAFPVIVVALALHARLGWASPLIPADRRADDPTLETCSWSPLDALLRSAGLHPADEGIVVATLHWIDGAQAGAALGAAWRVTVMEPDAHHFPYLHPGEEWIGRDVVFVGTPERLADVARYRDRFLDLESLGRVAVTRGGRDVFELEAVIGRHLLEPMPPIGAEPRPARRDGAPRKPPRDRAGRAPSEDGAGGAGGEQHDEAAPPPRDPVTEPDGDSP